MRLHAAFVRSTGLATSLVLALAAVPRADIVWQGRRVESWPEAAVSRAPTAGRSLATTASHYSSPKGKFYGLTLLVDFSDQAAPFTVAEVTDWLNLPGFSRNGCKGSIRDFYLDMSNGQFDFTNEVFGWYRAKHPKSWYEGLSGYTGSDSLLKEVFAHFDAQVDFSRYDNDKNGAAEAISIVYAGAGQTWGQGLWPHAGWAGQTRDGTRLERHQMSDLPGKFSLYVFAHECGHMVFGWPDLYWYGDYCAMANRADDLNPVAINDFFRADQGWIPFQDVTALDTAFVSSGDGEKVWRYRNPARPDEEGFAWSYLRNIGRRSVIAGSGLLLQHYDFALGGNSAANRLGLRVVQADGLEELQASQWPSKGDDPKDLFQSATTGWFRETRFPRGHWNDSSWSGLAFSEVGAVGANLSFRLGPPLPPAAASAVLEAESAQVVSAFVSTSTDARGGRYVGKIEASWSKVVFTANRPSAGLCSLVVRYANGGASNASHLLLHDGITDSVTYHPTGAWGRFDSTVAILPLKAGRNVLAFGRKTGYAELDAVRIAPAPASVAAGRHGTRIPSPHLERSGLVRVAPELAGSRLEVRDPSGRIVLRAQAGSDGVAGVLPPNLRHGHTLLWTLRLPDGASSSGAWATF